LLHFSDIRYVPHGYGTYYLSIALSSERDFRQHCVANCRNGAKGLSPALYKWGLFLYTAISDLLTSSLPPTLPSARTSKARYHHQLYLVVRSIHPFRSASRDAIALLLSSLAGVGRVLRLRLQHRWHWVQHHVCWLSASHARCRSAYDGYRRAVYPIADQRGVQRRVGISRGLPVQRRAALPGRQLLQHQR
jgi:hypothetical protein